MKDTTYHFNVPIKLALLSDIHGHPYDNIIESLRVNKPEIICFAGDVIYGSWPVNDISPLTSQPNVLPFLRACSGLAPTFLSLGNHDQMLDSEDIMDLKKTGVTFLDNNYVTANAGDKNVIIGGLTSAYVTDYRALTALTDGEIRYPRKELIAGFEGITTANEHIPDTSWLSDFTAYEGYHILLCHHPEYIQMIPKSIQLILSGHAHGGQWAYYSFKRKRMCGFFAPGQGFFPKYTKGIYENRLIVSAGLANTTKIPRFFNPREIVYICPNI